MSATPANTPATPNPEASSLALRPAGGLLSRLPGLDSPDAISLVGRNRLSQALELEDKPDNRYIRLSLYVLGGVSPIFFPWGALPPITQGVLAPGPALPAGALACAVMVWRGGGWLAHTWGAFPLGTLVVNCVGGLLIGGLWVLFERQPHEVARLLLVTGFLGGLTTFSAFSGESLGLLMRGRRKRVKSPRTTGPGRCCRSALAGLIHRQRFLFLPRRTGRPHTPSGACRH